MNFFRKAFLPIFLLCFVPCGFCAANGFDHSAWDVFLKKNVNEKGEVDYRAIVQDPKDLDVYLAKLMAVSKLDMKQWPREEALAFWINAYHAALIKLVTEHYPIASVQKIPSFWDLAKICLDKGTSFEMHHSLNDMRVKDLMGIYRDEKIHLALSMAARSGPPLSREAFTGPKVEGQLFLRTRKFVMDPAYVDIVPGKKKVRISKIFKWYGKDFRLDFGFPEPRGKFSDSDNAVLSFLAYYLEDEAKDEYLQEGRYKIEYPPFDWTLNDWKR